MIIEEITKESNNRKRKYYKIECIGCGETFFRDKYLYNKMNKKDIDYNGNHCKKCVDGVVSKRPDVIRKRTESIKNMYKNNPEILEKKRQSMKGKNVGDLNGMKRPEVQKKVSDTRKKMFEDPNVRKIYSDATKKAWADGKFEGVKVGQCKWHEFKSKSGTLYKVQGTWELAFIKWLDENDMKFTCHRGRIPYVLNGEEHSYYPDFYVEDWECYADVKAPYFHNEEKFKAIRESNKDISIKILFKEDLKELGVDIK